MLFKIVPPDPSKDFDGWLNWTRTFPPEIQRELFLSYMSQALGTLKTAEVKDFRDQIARTHAMGRCPGMKRFWK